MPLKEQIAVFDATMACLVSFLKSNSLDQTVYTNILLNDPELIEDEILKAMTTGLLQMTRTLKFIIDLGGISFDEDIALACKADETMLSSADNDNAIVFLKSVEKKMEKKLKTNLEKAMLHRLKFLRLFLEACACIVPPSSVLAPDSEEAFVVNFKLAAVCLSALMTSFSIIEKSINEGLSSENDDDGDYSWLSSFQPDVNRHLIPNSFPRAPLIDDRTTSYKFWKVLVENMTNMVRELPLKVGTIEDLLNYIREFTASDADIFNRCLLQVAVAPFGDSIFGNIPLNNLVINSLQGSTSPIVLDKNYPLYHSNAIQQYWQQVLTAISRSFLSLVQVYGMNETRQRDQITNILKEFNSLYYEAEIMDKKFLEYLRSHGDFSDVIEMKPFCISAYIGQHLMKLMRYYIVLGFKSELFVPYEFQYCYWYLGEVISMWCYRLFEQSKEYLIADLKLIPSHIDQKKFERKRKQREGFVRRKIEDIEVTLLHERIDALICRSLVSIVSGLVTAGHLEIPEGEKNRYSVRFEPFAHVPIFARITHKEYSSETEIGLLASLPAKKCYERAQESLAMAFDHLNRLKMLSSDDPLVNQLLPVIKKNLVVCRLLTAAPEKQVSFEFSKINFLYPMLKLV
uniref:Protein MAK10 homolog n=1 Tax=Panagrolaimus sp. JU765 TaxID=591449 RepID=A0AC34QJ46_9BILA